MVLVSEGGGMNLMILIPASYLSVVDPRGCVSGQSAFRPCRPLWEPRWSPQPCGKRPSSCSWAWASLRSWGRNQDEYYWGFQFICFVFCFIFLIILLFIFVFPEISSICCLQSKSRCFTKKVYIRSQIPNSFLYWKLSGFQSDGL